MKHFLLGLIAGGIAGSAASFLKDKNGDRIGQPIKKNLLAAANDAYTLKDGLHHAHRAISKINQNLPDAKRGLSDINSEVDRFKVHSQEKIRKIKNQTDHLQKVAAETKKN